MPSAGAAASPLFFGTIFTAFLRTAMFTCHVTLQESGGHPNGRESGQRAIDFAVSRKEGGAHVSARPRVSWGWVSCVAVHGAGWCKWEGGPGSSRRR